MNTCGRPVRNTTELGIADVTGKTGMLAAMVAATEGVTTQRSPPASASSTEHWSAKSPSSRSVSFCSVALSSMGAREPSLRQYSLRNGAQRPVAIRSATAARSASAHSGGVIACQSKGRSAWV